MKLSYMKSHTFTKFVILQTTILIEMISARNEIMVKTRNDCRCGEVGNIPVERIVGGKAAAKHAYPWQAWILIYSKVKGSTRCGGTVINNLYVLTAIHCVNRKDEINIILGLHDAQNENSKINQKYNVMEVIVHEHNADSKTDISLLKVDRNIIYNKHVKPICLPNQNEQIEGIKATVIGWGLKKWSRRNLNELHELDQRVMTRKECIQATRIKNLSYSMVCATAGDNRGVGSGDSGGPLFYKTKNGIAVQIGIVSSGGRVGYYTSVPMHVDWIHSRTKDASYCQRKL